MNTDNCDVIQIRFKITPPSVPRRTLRRFGRACCFRLLLPLAVWLLIYVSVIGRTVFERTSRISLTTGNAQWLCDHLADPRRVWGPDVSVDAFELPDDRQKAVWKMKVSGGTPVDGLSLGTATIHVHQRHWRHCEVLRIAMFCVGQTPLCVRSVTNTTLQEGRADAVNATQVVRLGMSLAFALLYADRVFRAHETMLTMSIQND